MTLDKLNDNLKTFVNNNKNSLRTVARGSLLVALAFAIIHFLGLTQGLSLNTQKVLGMSVVPLTLFGLALSYYIDQDKINRLLGIRNNL